MTRFTTLMIGSAGLALTLAAAAPASAQGYGYGYPQQPQGGVVGAIVNAVTGGYGQYPQGNYGYGQVDQRLAVQQCAAATEQRINGNVRGQGYGAYNGNGYQNGYGRNGYQVQGGARVVGITSIEPRNRGAIRVHGVATSGNYAQQGYNGYGRQGYNQQMAADLTFSCKVTLQGRVSDLKIGRNDGRNNRGYNRGY